MPDLSIVIPTLNRYKDLKNTIIDLSHQSFQDYEILIVDQTIDPEEVKPVGNLTIRYYWLNELSASAARNLGIKEANGRIILFLDDDIVISNKEFLANHMRHFSDPSIPGAIGCIMDPDGLKRTDRHKWSFRDDIGWLFFPRNYAFPAKVRTGGSGNLSVRRTVAIESGGMDENYVKGAHREESDFCIRVCKKFGLFEYDPEADLIHLGSPQGGIRSWNMKSSILRKQQHYDGAFYFMIKNFKIREFPYHLGITIFFFLYDKRLVTRPHLAILSIYRMLKGIWYGFRNYRTPKYLK